MKDCVDCYRELLATIGTLVKASAMCFAFECVMFC